ncbi:MAG TPA: radical SAM protein [Miltoncostaeaceae bacterium]|nr:radical SAM protein [Miltoncostaeaceae bacterium]
MRGAPPDLERHPIVVAWEVTRACGYRCRHCRADAMPRPAPGQLDHAESLALIDDLARFAGSILVLTGGDPMLRPDLADLVARAAGRGLRVALTPSATARVTPERLDALRRAGVAQVAVSLDGPDAATHDALRGVRGSFARTLRILRHAREAGFPLQVNTTLTAGGLGRLDEMARRVATVRPALWSVFFLVPTGRGARGDMLPAHAQERALRRLVRMRGRLPMPMKVTAAPAVRRVQDQMAAEGLIPPPPPPVPVNDGRGFMFVSHDGHVAPSGFLPLPAGNVRARSAVDLYRGAPLFRALRDPSRLRGRCGRCEWRDVCGGSRARAFALSGDPLAEEPTCAYRPRRGRAC